MSCNCDVNTKCVLLVDDEALVRRTCHRMLTRMGYEVLDAPDGQAALNLYRQHWRSISVVLLDMVMPNMNGSTTFEKLRQVNPDARVILSSGYPEDDTVNNLLTDPAVVFMRKPYGLQELLDTVQRVSVRA
jgi:two-component system, cell cycle sensor histidine kinase and response regulator CckA